ncbi:hypothetical protein IF2G_05842 [Cordyceps javanica]|nr:hypothetical protein IF2G_05842 [Cordyceps javanica]
MMGVIKYNSPRSARSQGLAIAGLPWRVSSEKQTAGGQAAQHWARPSMPAPLESLFVGCHQSTWRPLFCIVPVRLLIVCLVNSPLLAANGHPPSQHVSPCRLQVPRTQELADKVPKCPLKVTWSTTNSANLLSKTPLDSQLNTNLGKQASISGPPAVSAARRPTVSNGTCHACGFASVLSVSLPLYLCLCLCQSHPFYVSFLFISSGRLPFLPLPLLTPLVYYFLL